MIPFKSLTALLLLGATAFSQAGSLEEVLEKGTLRVALYRDHAPYSYTEGGRTVGLNVDIARALAERLGVSMSIMPLTASDEAMEDDLRNAIWKGHYLGGGTADVMLHVPVNDDFAEENDQVIIFGAYLREEMAIAHDLERIPRLSTLMFFISESTIGVELETIGDMYLTRAEGGRLMQNIRRFRTREGACEALLAGEVNAFMAPRLQLEHCLQGNERFAVSQVPVAVGLFAWDVGMAVKEDYPELASALEEALQGLREDGTLDEIFAAHGLSPADPLRQVAQGQAQ